MTFKEVTQWFKRNYLAVMGVIIILMLLPVLLRGLRLDFSVILSGALSASVNGVFLYFTMKAIKKFDGKGKEDK